MRSSIRTFHDAVTGVWCGARGDKDEGCRKYRTQSPAIRALRFLYEKRCTDSLPWHVST